MSEAKIKDHGPGICDVPGCGQPRYFFPARSYHAPVCAVHAWERITKALDEDGDASMPHAESLKDY